MTATKSIAEKAEVAPSRSVRGFLAHLMNAGAGRPEAVPSELVPALVETVDAALGLAKEQLRADLDAYPDASLDLSSPVLLAWSDLGVTIMVPTKGHTGPHLALLQPSQGAPEATARKKETDLVSPNHSSKAARYSFSFVVSGSIIASEVRPIADLPYNVPKNTSKNSSPEALRPRWAEENRPKKQVKLRLPPDLIDKVDEEAAAKGVTRNDWIEGLIEKALTPK